MAIAKQLATAVDGWRLQRVLSGPYDDRGAILCMQVRSLRHIFPCSGLHPTGCGMGCTALPQFNTQALSWQAGAGGVDAMDWAERVERMYLRWCSNRDFRTIVNDRSAGDILTPCSSPSYRVATICGPEYDVSTAFSHSTVPAACVYSTKVCAACS